MVVDSVGNAGDNVAGSGFFNLDSFSSEEEQDEQQQEGGVDDDEVVVVAPTRETTMTVVLTSDGAMEIHQIHRLGDGSRQSAPARIAQLRRLQNTIAEIIMCEEQAERSRARFRALDDAEVVE
jgi:hypothetical protein